MKFLRKFCQKRGGKKLKILCKFFSKFGVRKVKKIANFDQKILTPSTAFLRCFTKNLCSFLCVAGKSSNFFSHFFTKIFHWKNWNFAPLLGGPPRFLGFPVLKVSEAKKFYAKNRQVRRFCGILPGDPPKKVPKKSTPKPPFFLGGGAVPRVTKFAPLRCKKITKF